MPNSYFEFKQFRIEQDECAMKVTTEGCVFGALIQPEKYPDNILDIGTGTGLLALMLVQKYPDAKSDAVEFDEKAFNQSKRNFQSSHWRKSLNAHHSAIQDFESVEKYDLIVSNPPFFKKSMIGRSHQGNLAKHEQHLNQNDLLMSVEKLLAPEGEFWVLYPPSEAVDFLNLTVQSNFYRHSKINVFDKEDKKVLRIVQCFSKVKKSCSEQNLIIKTSEGYTKAFQKILGDYYLNL